MNTFVETRSGKLLDLVNPQIDQIDIKDIAWSLSRIPRFGGHTVNQTCLNVAEHSLFVARLANSFDKIARYFSYRDDELHIETTESDNLIIRFRDIQEKEPGFIGMVALLHDAHEAYFNDIISPVKNLPNVRESLRPFVQNLDAAIYKKIFGYTFIDPKIIRIIKICDSLAQAIEARGNLKSRGEWFNLGFSFIHEDLYSICPKATGALPSYEAFLLKYRHLKNRLR